MKKSRYIKKPKADIYFSGDDAHAFLPWVIGIMACMATLFLCLGVSVGSWIIDRGGNYTNSFTVNVPSNADDFPTKLIEIKKTLDSMPGIIKVSEVGQDKIKDMLKPWLGGMDSIDSIPLPAVLEITIDPVTSIDFKLVQVRLNKIVSGSVVDTHEAWVASFSHFSSTMRLIMTLLATLIIGGLTLMIAFTSRASLKLHARTVSLLHSIGAEDEYIMRQFQLEAFLVTLRGTIPGCLLAGAAYWGAGLYINSLHSIMLLPLAIRTSHIMLLITMPLACGAIAWLAARISVIKQLQRVL